MKAGMGNLAIDINLISNFSDTVEPVTSASAPHSIPRRTFLSTPSLRYIFQAGRQFQICESILRSGASVRAKVIHNAA
jgi:hypothetical protein